jgi:hypothetical protein
MPRVFGESMNATEKARQEVEAIYQRTRINSIGLVATGIQGNPGTKFCSEITFLAEGLRDSEGEGKRNGRKGKLVQ